MGLPGARGAQPREEAVGRQARPPGIDPRPRPLSGRPGAVEDRGRQARGRRPRPRHTVRVDPDLDLFKSLSRGVSDNNYARYKDPTLDDLYLKQSRAIDPEERRKWVREFERRLLDEEAHYVYTLQWHRIIPHSAKLRGWTITPSHYLNNQLDGVWLAE